MAFTKSEILYEATNPSELHLIILPTEKCNFRCTYCYEDHVAPRMRDEIVSSIIAYIDRTLPDLSHFTIDWFGGEPLLGMPVIRKVNGFVRDLMRGEGTKAWFRSGMTTNGYLLTRDLFHELLDLGVVQYQVTLDGPRDLHDTTRIRTGGGASFDQIWENLLSMHNTDGDFEVLLRVHLMRRNIDRIPELIKSIETHLGSDSRFKLFLKPIKNLGGGGAGFCATESLGGGDEIASELQSKLATSRSFWSPNPICHASKLNSHLIRADGRIARCTTALDDPVNTVGRLSPDGRLELDRDKILAWSRGVFDMDPDHLYCPYGGIGKALVAIGESRRAV